MLSMINLNNKKIINTTAFISGVLPVAYLITNTGLKDKSQPPYKIFLVRLLGYILSITTYFLSIISIEKYVLDANLFSNKVQGYILALLIFMIIQISVAYAFMLICSKFFSDTLRFSVNVSSRKVMFYYVLNVSLGILMTGYLFVSGPFLFVFTSIYLIPNIYLYSHFRKIFRSGKSILIFTIVFFIVVSTFVFSNAATENINSTFSKSIIYTGYYYAPWLLYTFLLYLFWDVFTFIMSVIQSEIREQVHSYRVRRMVFFSVVLIACITEITGVFNFNNTRIRKYDIQLAQKESELKELKIAMAADFHFSEITNDYFIHQFIEKLNSVNADIVLFVGDIFESGRSNPKMKDIQNQLRLIKSKYGVFAVEGNHEYYNGTNGNDCFINSDITLLRDTIIVIDDYFQIAGRMDKHNRNRLSLDTLLNRISPELPVIVMDHQPQNETKSFDKIDVYLSGHTHNGQLFPFNLITKLIYELSWGYKETDNTHYFVTCGAQGWGPQVKTASHSEIMEINVAFK